ncbi:MAG: RnfABCDGE type electron transport complex subunit G, partial [Planctomycetota bacterium]
SHSSKTDEPTTIRLVLTLTIAGLVAGMALVGTYLFTKPIIEANKQRELEESIFIVLPGCKRFLVLENQNQKLVKVSPKAKSKNPRIYLGFDEHGKMVGFAIPGKEAGFQDVIEAIFGYHPKEDVIVGFRVLESRETPGLGDKITKDKDFLNNFKALAVSPIIVPVKKGEKKKKNELETITGATISSKAVVRLLNKAIQYWKPLIHDYLKRNSSHEG